MKRNKKAARKLRAGRHTYSKQRKRPCLHCQQVTRDSREAAQRGKPATLEPMSEGVIGFARGGKQ